MKRPVFIRRYMPYYIENLKLALPLMVAQLGQILVQLADNIMVGRWGGENALPLAAVSFGGQVAALFFLFSLGITMGLTPVVGELVGRKRTEGVGAWLMNGVMLYVGLGIIMMLLQLALQPLLFCMGQPVEVVEAALPYYRIMAYSIPPIMLFASFKQLLEGLGNTWISMVVLLGANLMNVLFNYLFIFGRGGCPELGITGAAVSTFLARCIAPISVILVFLLNKKYRTHLIGWRIGMASRRMLRRLIYMGLPIAGQIILEASAFVFTSIMMGWFDTVAISANQISNTMGNCSFSIVLALGAATTIRVSHAYGARDYQKMERSAWAALHVVFAWNTFTAILFFSLRNVIPTAFTANPEVIELAAILLICTAFFQFFDGLQNVSIGILRGLQDVKIIPLFSFLAYFVLNIPIAYLLAFPLGMGPAGLVLACSVGLFTAALLGIRRIKRDIHRLKAAQVQQEAELAEGNKATGM